MAKKYHFDMYAAWKIRAMRKELGLTVDQLIKKSGVGRSIIEQMEKNQIRLRSEKAYKLQEFLDEQIDRKRTEETSRSGS